MTAEQEEEEKKEELAYQNKQQMATGGTGVAAVIKPKAQDEEKTCVKIRQPPGGASSGLW